MSVKILHNKSQGKLPQDKTLGVIPGDTAVSGCMALDWHPEQRY